MNLDKAKKRIAKYVNKGFKGYPQITLAYYGQDKLCATEVVIQFIQAEGEAAQEERFSCPTDVRESELIQTTLLKIIERANVSSVIEIEGTAVR